MRYLVAVSGGIDSVALLDMLARDARHELIVATFDHGIREESASDVRFVAGLAAKYNLPFVTRREELGREASEETARERRYAFLRFEAEKREAIIVTAHHQDDVVESIVINLMRGTGWRGLAVLGASDVKRPLLRLSKKDIREYAHVNRLEWVEDHTNAELRYLRNRVRRQINMHLKDNQRYEVINAWNYQVTLAKQIDELLNTYVRREGEYSRYFFTMIDPLVANELLRKIVAAKSGRTPTRPQADRALVAIKTARSGAVFEMGSGVDLCFRTRTFVVSAP